MTLAQMATMIKGRTPEEVNEGFGLDGSVSEEAIANVHTEHPWLMVE